MYNTGIGYYTDKERVVKVFKSLKLKAFIVLSLVITLCAGSFAGAAAKDTEVYTQVVYNADGSAAVYVYNNTESTIRTDLVIGEYENGALVGASKYAEAVVPAKSRTDATSKSIALSSDKQYTITNINLKDGTAYEIFEEPVSPKEFDADKIVLSFGAISDIHLTGEYETSADVKKTLAAFEQLKKQAAIDDKDGLDAVAIAGDLTEDGYASEVKLLERVLKESGIGKNVLLTTGNHDYYGDADATMQDLKSVLGDEYFALDVDMSDFENGSRHCVVGDYHFIFVEPASYGKWCPYKEETLTWLDNTLSDITTKDPDSYVFVFTHPLIYGTAYGSDLGAYWGTKYLADTLSKYPQVMAFGGHLHFAINDERSISQTDFTALGCGSVSYLAIGATVEKQLGAEPERCTDVSSGYLVQVDENGNVRITRMDFTNEGTFKQPWTVSAPKADKSHLTKYTSARADKNIAPVMPGSIDSKVFLDGVMKVGLSFPAAKDDDLVHHYLVNVISAEEDKTTTYKFFSDFYLHSQPEDMKDVFECTVPVYGKGKHKIEIVAVDSWGAKSNAVSTEVDIDDSSVNAVPPEAYVDIDMSTDGTIKDSKGNANVTLNGALVENTAHTFNGNTAEIPSFNVKESGQHAVVNFNEYNHTNITDLYNGKEGFSVEGLFVNRSPAGSQSIAGANQSGGWNFALSDNSPYMYIYLSSSAKIYKEMPLPTDELTHMLLTFFYDEAAEKTKMTLYVNGKEISTLPALGEIRISAIEKAAATFCLGADVDENGMGTQNPMTDFSLADFKLYKSALNYKQVKTACDNATAVFNK